jgi:hypothetical protein
MDRLEFAGFERERIGRIEGADGRWSVGVYVDHEDAPRVRAIIADTNAPTSRDVLNSFLIFGAAALAGLAVMYLLPRRIGRRGIGRSRDEAF